MTVTLSDEQDDPLPHEALVSLAESVMNAEHVPENAEVSLILVSAEHVAELNEQYLSRTGPTDVLAFPIEDLRPGEAFAASEGGPPLMLGDVFVCPAVVRANAGAAGVPFDDEMALMVVHGMLHLLGYDHQEELEAERMEAREREILALSGRERP